MRASRKFSFVRLLFLCILLEVHHLLRQELSVSQIFQTGRVSYANEYGTVQPDLVQKGQDQTSNNKPHHVIVVPYRNREANLKQFIEYMGPYLSRNFASDTFSLFIVEQADSEPFNRGFLFNVGLNELRESNPATQCVIIHDVDLLPKNDGVPYNNCTRPMRLGNELEHFHWKVPFPRYMGGVLSLDLQDWQLVNGMPNDYEGWGGEDDDVFYRLKQNGLLNGDNFDVATPPKGKGVYVNIDKNTKVVSKKSKRNHTAYAKNKLMKISMMRKSSRWKLDGLSDLGYAIREDQILTVNGTEPFKEVHLVKVIAQTPAVDLAAPIDDMWEVNLAKDAAKIKSADAADTSDLFASIEYAYLTPHLPDMQTLEAVQAIKNPVVRYAVQQRRTCLEHIRARHDQVLALPLVGNKKEVLLVDGAYHSNVGDSMLTEAEKLFNKRHNLKTLECYTNQAELRKPKPPPRCNTTVYSHYSKDHGVKYALWHAGGNWGDMWDKPHLNRSTSFVPLLQNNYTVVQMPQSLHFTSRNKSHSDANKLKTNIMKGLGITKANLTAEQIKLTKSRVVLTWRSQSSYEEGVTLYPYADNRLVPDIAFQLGPYEAYPPQKDLVILLRKDKESIMQAYRNETVIQQALESLTTKNISFELVDWIDRARLFQSKITRFDKASVRLMSYGKVMIADRLHASILAYLSGVPLVYLDQSYGKINKTLSVAFDSWEGCRDYDQTMIARATSFEEGLKTAIGFLEKY
jgi:exopolysaccharide biosynthesis predicted pyruvyltransferase EpsI